MSWRSFVDGLLGAFRRNRHEGSKQPANRQGENSKTRTDISSQPNFKRSELQTHPAKEMSPLTTSPIQPTPSATLATPLSQTAKHVTESNDSQCCQHQHANQLYEGLKETGNTSETIPSSDTVKDSSSPTHLISAVCKDEQQTYADEGNWPNNGPNESLWDCAYTALRLNDRQLVEKYEELLSKELPGRFSSNVSRSNSITQTETSLVKVDNRIENVNTSGRRAQLDILIHNGLQRVDEKKVKYTIAGHEFILQEQIEQAAKLLQWAKGLVDEAVKVSPEASIAWAGVCLILPLLTQPMAAEEANRIGLTYVIARMRFYAALEPLLPPQNQSYASTYSRDLKAEFETSIVELYQCILEFQFKSVLHFYQSRGRSFAHSLFGHTDWKALVSHIQELERVLAEDLKKIDGSILRQDLEKLNKSADESLQSMHELLSVTERQLKMVEEHRDIASEQLHFNKQQVQILSVIAQSIQEANDGGEPVYLPTVANALYDSAEDQHIPLCQEGTRIGIFNKINEWVMNSDNTTILWIHGPAGTGKSTISRSVARSLADNNLLGASYFFRRGQEGRNRTTRLFSTLASQLTATVPLFKSYFKESLDAAKILDIEKVSLDKQFRTLILAPLSKVSEMVSPNVLTRVIIIDALDECECPEDIPIICEQLSKLMTISSVRLCVLLTSRYAYPVADGFQNLKDAAYRSLALQRMFYNETKDDIAAVLTAKFADIKRKRNVSEDPWPKQSDLSRVISLATTPSPLFIYATTLCRFVYDAGGRKNPVNQLKIWLKQSDINSSQLSKIYIPIVRQVLFGLDEDGEKEKPLESEDLLQMRQVLGSLVSLATPIPASVLASLIGVDKDAVSHWLRNFHAVLDIPNNPDAPVRLLHKSFSDFLLAQEEMDSFNFRLNAIEFQGMLASKCMQHMKELRLGFLNVLEGKVKFDQRSVAYSIPPILQYSCQYWVYHLLYDRECNLDEETVKEFLQEYLDYWVECLFCTLSKLSSGKAEPVENTTAQDFIENTQAHNRNPTNHAKSDLAFLRIRNLIVNGIIRNSRLGLGDICDILRHLNLEVQEVCFDVSLFNSKEYALSDFIESLVKYDGQDLLRYESVLKYVRFPDLNTPRQTEDIRFQARNSEIRIVFNWLKSKGVRQVLDLLVPDRLRFPHSDDDVAYCVNGSAVRVLNWRKLDFSLCSLIDKNDLQELHLYSSGDQSVYTAWFRELVKFSKLKKLYINIVTDVLTSDRVQLVKDELQELVLLHESQSSHYTNPKGEKGQKLPDIHVDEFNWAMMLEENMRPQSGC